jgi:hypothetical protein
MSEQQSAERIKFENAVKRGNWLEAFQNLHVLNMKEMLASLDHLRTSDRLKFDALISRRFAYKDGLNMARMEYAWTVVQNRSLPLVAPGDLSQTDQVAIASRFVGRTPAARQVALNIMVFTNRTVTNRSMFGELRQRADAILASQGNGFKLDVVMYPRDLELGEAIYLSEQLEELVGLAKKATSIPSNRLIVLLAKIQQGVGAHGLAVMVDGKRVAVIDTENPAADRTTLLHEIGHGAGLPEGGEKAAGRPTAVDFGYPENVMASPRGPGRDQLTVAQGEYLSRAFFAVT